MKRALRILLKILISLLLLFVVISFLLTLPAVQTKLAQFATEKIKEKLDIDVTINKLALHLDGSVDLNEFLLKDKYQDTLIYAGNLETQLNDISNLLDNKLILSNVETEDLKFQIITYKGDQKSNLDDLISKFETNNKSESSFLFQLDCLELTNASFLLKNYNHPQTKPIALTQINSNITDLEINGKDINATIDDLNLQTHWGVYIKNLQTKISKTNDSLSFSNLVVKTKNSKVEGSLKLNTPNGSFSNFTNNVVMNLRLNKSSISTKDLQRFYKGFASNQSIYLTTTASGTLNNFKLSNIYLQTSNQASFFGQISLGNLFNDNKSFKVSSDFDKISISRKKIIGLIPKALNKALPKEIDKLGEITSNGRMYYSNYELDADIELMSSIGSIQGTIEMSNINKSKQATYLADVTINDFYLNQFIDNKYIGKISAQTVISGKGLDKKSLETSLTGTINELEFKDHIYKDIYVNGVFKLPYYNGVLKINDPNIKLDFDGSVDLTNKTPVFDFKTNIINIDLEKSNLIPNLKGMLSGEILFSGVGNNFNDFDGSIELKNVNYKPSDNKSYLFGDLILDAETLENNNRLFKVSSDDSLKGTVEGQFTLNEIPKIIQNAVGSIFTNYKPYPLKENQFLDFNFSLNNKIVELIAPNISISNQTKINGEIDADQGKFKLNLNTPQFKLDNNVFKQLNVTIDNKNPLFNTFIEVDTIQIGKVYQLSEFSLINVKDADTLYVHTEFKGGTKIQDDKYDLNFYYTIAEENQSILGIQKSDVLFKNNWWYINEKNENKNRLVFDKKIDKFNIEPISISNGRELIVLEGNINGKIENTVQLTFEDVAIDELIPEQPSLEIKGLMNGIVKLNQKGKVYNPFSQLQVSDLSINKIDLGDLKIDVSGENIKNLDVDATLINDTKKHLNLTGKVSVNSKKTNLNLNADVNDLDLKILTPFFNTIFDKFRGKASGTVKVKGTATQPKIKGKLALNSAGLQSIHTGVDYAFEPNAPLTLTESEFKCSNVGIIDTKSNTKGRLDLLVTHNKFKNWYLDTKVSSNNLLGFDTEYKEGTIYYGTAYIDGVATIKGPVKKLKIGVDVKSMPGTELKLALDDAGGLGNNNYVSFLSKEEKDYREKGMHENLLPKKDPNGIQLNFNFNVNPNASIEILLDRLSGHSMKGSGAGSVFMEINTLGRYNMWGDFVIYDGDYNFKFEGIIDKKFKVKKYGTISWDGNPLNAILDLEAVYKTRSNPAVILENSEINRQIDTEVSIAISEKLTSPNIQFNIDFPNVSPILKSEIEYALADKDKREKQAMALLATGSFITVSNASNAVYGSLFERASSLFEELLSDEDSMFKVGLDYTQSSNDPLLAQETNSRVGITLKTQISDRLFFNGKFGVPVGSEQKSVIVGDVELQFLLNADGSLKARIFNRENNITYLGEGIGYTKGGGLTYDVDFDNFKELIQKIIKTEKKKQTEKEESKK